jgi:hypothetical protein
VPPTKRRASIALAVRLTRLVHQGRRVQVGQAGDLRRRRQGGRGRGRHDVVPRHMSRRGGVGGIRRTRLRSMRLGRGGEAEVVENLGGAMGSTGDETAEMRTRSGSRALVLECSDCTNPATVAPLFYQNAGPD